jgi:hypothetical protein
MSMTISAGRSPKPILDAEAALAEKFLVFLAAGHDAPFSSRRWLRVLALPNPSPTGPLYANNRAARTGG